MVRIFVVTEMSVFRLLLLAALRRKILILDIDPILPYTKGILTRLVTMLVRARGTKWAIDLFPELNRVKDVPRRTLLYDVFGQIESWQNDYFGFAEAEKTLGEYSMAYRMAVTNHVSKKHVSLLVLRALFKEKAKKTYIFIGMPEDTLAAGENFCGQPIPCAGNWLPSRLINFALFAAASSSSLLWILFHFRLRKPEAKAIFFAADFIGDERDVRLYKELEDGGPMLMVPRGVGKNSPLAAELGGYTICDLAGGFVMLKDIFPVMMKIFGDELRFYRHFNAVYPALFKRLATLPYKRLLYRGLFTRFRPKYFWGRDPYNEDHIIRRQELNKLGGQSWGVNTGALTWAILIPETRYVSYDRYYVFGRGKYEKYYGHTWAKDMEVVPAGSFTGHREHYDKRLDPRPPDIAVFVSVFIGEPEQVSFVRGLAAAFPDRKIILQVKINFVNVPGTQGFIDACRKNLPNVEHSSDSVFDIFLRASYGVSDPSSVVLEALQFGMISFAFDLPQLQATNVNREYPGLTVGSAEEMTKRIHGIELGKWRYPIEDLQDVVDLSGMVFFDRIRRDMGLPPKEANVPLLMNVKEGAS